MRLLLRAGSISFYLNRSMNGSLQSFREIEKMPREVEEEPALDQQPILDDCVYFSVLDQLYLITLCVAHLD